MRIKLNEEDYRCGLVQCYENIARKAGYTPTDKTEYDCRHVNVSRHIQDTWYEHYYALIREREPFLAGSDIMRSITMLLLNSGAKVQADLSDNEVHIESGFISDPSA